MKRQRIKIISKYEPLPGIQCKARTRVLWPCHAFNVTWPRKSRDKLNIFEETILKLTTVVSNDGERLAKVSSLPLELVLFIQSQLQNETYLDEDYNITESGHAVLDKCAPTIEDYRRVTVYVDLLTGRVLNYVNSHKHQYENVLEHNNKFVKFIVGPVGNTKELRAKPLYYHETFKDKVPSTCEVIRAAEQYCEKHRKCSILSGESIGQEIVIPQSDAITIDSTPELIYLNCSIILEPGRTDVIVTGGCGLGISGTFTKYLRQQEYKWLNKFKKDSAVEKYSEHNEKPQFGRFSEKFKIYPQVCRALRQALEKYADYKKYKSTSNEATRRRRDSAADRALVGLYEVVEWSLRQIVNDNPVMSQWEKILLSQSYEDNGRLLCSFALQLGYSMTLKDKNLLKVQSGKIVAIRSGHVELQPILALALVGATQTGQHPLSRMAVVDSHFISFLTELKSIRDAIQHGNYSSTNSQKLPDYKERVFQFLETVFHDCVLQKNPVLYGSEDEEEESLKAVVELEEFFGRTFNTMPADLREILLRSVIEMNDNLQKTENQQQAVNGLAAALQQSLLQCIKGHEQTGSDLKDDIRLKAFRRAFDAELLMAPNSIPKSLSTVREQHIGPACKGKSSTLGATFIALFYVYPEAKLQELARKLPDMIQIVSELIELRGHGIDQGKTISNDILMSIKTNVFNMIKVLMEI